MTIDFDVKLEQKYDHPFIKIKGELDLHTCTKLNDILTDSLINSDTIIILDLSETQYMDSTALGAIARLAKSFAQKNGEIRLICQKSHIIKLFTISGLLKKNINIFDTEEEASRDLVKAGEV